MKAIWTGFAMLGLAGCAATTNGQTAAATQQQQPTPQQIVAARQTAYHLTAVAMGSMRGAIERGGDVSGQAFAARGVARWASVLPSMFPPSTSVTPSRARPEIWSNRADFEAKAAAFAAAATRLAELAQANDKEGFAAQHRATSATCAACNELYQAPQNRGG
jgi:cytochrome c556